MTQGKPTCRTMAGAGQARRGRALWRWQQGLVRTSSMFLVLFAVSSVCLPGAFLFVAPRGVRPVPCSASSKRL